ncbi:glycosyltransferase family 4 protein [Novipirellula artificiosorum]|uniref:2-deoxystreptamine glucosyltransferase n=1 Tax=Novipirellula artificiosorum TaxID=2528016 RepID=A0A5C6DDW3_9BACT|nr:glycosyltransferase family 4 protein [Novipirellula artificiosorum]TWU34942.1 2-deoxystreptamine glucosyltransferase [Novipirellula artificiosorum]
MIEVLNTDQSEMRPKRILMLLENQSFPDDVRVLLEAEALLAAGYELTVICPTGDSRQWFERVGECRVYRYPQPFEAHGFLGYVFEYGYSLTALFLWSLYVFVRHGFDVVHVHTPPDMTAMIAIFYKVFGKRFVFDLHDLSPELYLARRQDDRPNIVYKLLLFFERLACRGADRLIATNASQRDIQVNRCGADEKDCSIVRNGPNGLFLSEVQAKQDLVDRKKITLGYVGAIGIQDGVDYMVRAVHELKVQHQREDFIAVIVGDGPAMKQLRKLAVDLDVQELICFTGGIPFASVPAYIAAFDICLTPDPSNAYNDSCTTIKTMEYMALRKPTVCFRTRENQLTAGDAALYANNNDVSEFSRLVCQLMDEPLLRASMGEIARARIDNGLTWKHQAVSLVSLYESLFDPSI